MLLTKRRHTPDGNEVRIDNAGVEETVGVMGWPIYSKALKEFKAHY